MDFFQKFPNLEEYSNSSYSDCFGLNYISNLKNLRLLQLSGFESGIRNFSRNPSLDFLNDFSNLVTLGLDLALDFSFAEDIFASLKALEHLKIKAKQGNWMSHLTYNLKSLDLHTDDCDFASINRFTQLTKLRLQFKHDLNVLRMGAFKSLINLKCLDLNFWISEIEANAFEGLESLTELEMKISGNEVLPKSNLFNSLSGLKKLLIRGRQVDMDANFLDKLPNLISLQLFNFTRFQMTEKTFSKQRNLNTLLILNCQIETLPDNVFLNLRNLTKLYMDEISLTTLNENALNGLDNLKFLKINADDAFREVKMNLLTKLPHLKYLVLPERFVTDSLRNQFRNLNVDVSFW
jgi:hypothetical protein